jgi:hypothetical protein
MQCPAGPLSRGDETNVWPGDHLWFFRPSLFSLHYTGANWNLTIMMRSSGLHYTSTCYCSRACFCWLIRQRPSWWTRSIHALTASRRQQHFDSEVEHMTCTIDRSSKHKGPTTPKISNQRNRNYKCMCHSPWEKKRQKRLVSRRALRCKATKQTNQKAGYMTTCTVKKQQLVLTAKARITCLKINPIRPFVLLLEPFLPACIAGILHSTTSSPPPRNNQSI